MGRPRRLRVHLRSQQWRRSAGGPAPGHEPFGGKLMTRAAETHRARITPAPSSHGARRRRSEEHTSELQSLMRISYAVFCLKKKKQPRRPTRYLRTYTTTNKQQQIKRNSYYYKTFTQKTHEINTKKLKE